MFGSLLIRNRVATLISGGTGTTTGNMSGQAGLAAAFDGQLTEAYPTGMAAELASTGDATVGKIWSAKKTITRFRVSFQGTGGSPPYNSGSATLSTLTLDGSDDGSVWTALYTYPSPIAGNFGGIIDITSGIDVSTAYLRHRVRMQTGSAANTYVSEIEFYEDI